MLTISYKNLGSCCSKLAFNINISCYYRNKKHTYETSKIYVNNYPKYFLERRIFVRNTLNKQKIYNYVLNSNTQKLRKFFYSIKFYGYLSNLKVFYIKRDTDRYFFLDLQANPIIKSINIIGYKKLYIPQSLILKLFKDQLGLPKNYSKINAAINIIKCWYKSNGFLWAEVKFVKQNLANDISIKINEGKIKEIKFICQSYRQIDSKTINEINLLIKQELRILPGSLLNSKYLEEGIEKLKNYHHIHNCHYQIIESVDGMSIILKYSLPSYEWVQCSGTQLLAHNNLFLLQYPFLNFLNLLANIKYCDCYCPVNSYKAFPFQKLLNNKKYINLKFSQSKNLYFKGLEFNNSFDFINTFNYKRNSYTYTSNINKFNLPSIYSQIAKMFAWIYPKKNLITHVYIMEQFGLIHSTVYKKSLKLIKTNFNDNTHIFITFKSLRKSFINLYFRCRVNKDYIFKYIEGNHSLATYIDLSICLLNSIISRFFNFHFLALNQFVQSKYKHTIYVSRLFPWMRSSRLSFLLSNNLLIENKKDLCTSPFYRDKSINLKLLSTVKFEYDISMIKYGWLYCFVNMLLYSNFSGNKTYDSNLLRTPTANNYKDYTNSHLGLGLQFDSLIRYVPPIRLEFILDYKTHNIIHLYIYHTYNE